MSLIKPMELIASMSGKICGHSNKYFAVRNGTQYTGTICNPYTGEPTEKQIAVRQKFADTYGIDHRGAKGSLQRGFPQTEEMQDPSWLHLLPTL